MIFSISLFILLACLAGTVWNKVFTFTLQRNETNCAALLADTDQCLGSLYSCVQWMVRQLRTLALYSCTQGYCAQLYSDLGCTGHSGSQCT